MDTTACLYGSRPRSDDRAPSNANMCVGVGTTNVSNQRSDSDGRVERVAVVYCERITVVRPVLVVVVVEVCTAFMVNGSTGVAT